jgi:hypothetical protein
VPNNAKDKLATIEIQRKVATMVNVFGVIACATCAIIEVATLHSLTGVCSSTACADVATYERVVQRYQRTIEPPPAFLTAYVDGFDDFTKSGVQGRNVQSDNAVLSHITSSSAGTGVFTVNQDSLEGSSSNSSPRLVAVSSAETSISPRYAQESAHDDQATTSEEGERVAVLSHNQELMHRFLDIYEVRLPEMLVWLDSWWVWLTYRISELTTALAQLPESIWHFLLAPTGTTMVNAHLVGSVLSCALTLVMFARYADAADDKYHLLDKQYKTLQAEHIALQKQSTRTQERHRLLGIQFNILQARCDKLEKEKSGLLHKRDPSPEQQRVLQEVSNAFERLKRSHVALGASSAALEKQITAAVGKYEVLDSEHVALAGMYASLGQRYGAVNNNNIELGEKYATLHHKFAILEKQKIPTATTHVTLDKDATDMLVAVLQCFRKPFPRITAAPKTNLSNIADMLWAYAQTVQRRSRHNDRELDNDDDCNNNDDEWEEDTTKTLGSLGGYLIERPEPKESETDHDEVSGQTTASDATSAGDGNSSGDVHGNENSLDAELELEDVSLATDAITEEADITEEDVLKDDLTPRDAEPQQLLSHSDDTELDSPLGDGLIELDDDFGDTAAGLADLEVDGEGIDDTEDPRDQNQLLEEEDDMIMTAASAMNSPTAPDSHDIPPSPVEAQPRSLPTVTPRSARIETEDAGLTSSSTRSMRSYTSARFTSFKLGCAPASLVVSTVSPSFSEAVGMFSSPRKDSPRSAATRFLTMRP